MFTEDDLTIRYLEIRNVWKCQDGLFRLCFLFPQQGQGTYTDAQTARPFSAGDVLVLNTGVKHAIRPQGRGKLTVAIFHACIEHLLVVFPLNEFCLLENSLKTVVSPWFYPADSRLALTCHPLLDAAPADLGVEHRCHVLRIVAIILSKEFNLSPPQGQRQTAPARPNAHLLDRLSLQTIQTSSVEELSRSYGCSRRHLGRLFQERLGTSVSALKMELRLLKAVALLRNPALKVASVGIDCGFNHLSLFSARFRKRFGLSPSEWRAKALSSTPKYSLGESGEICPLQAKGMCPMPDQRDLAKTAPAGTATLSEPVKQKTVSDQETAP